MKKNILLTFFIFFLIIFVFWIMSSNRKQEEQNINTNEQNTMQELQMEIIQMGQGREAQNGDTLKVHYTGTLEDGTKFDSSLDRGTPFEFILGAGKVIKGWDDGLFGMKAGGKRKLIIPPHLAYGDQSPSPKIPSNSTLIFEIELLEIK